MSLLPHAEPECTRASTPGVLLGIESRRRDVEGLPVRRSLPSPARRTVGPFVFFDHMGPVRLAPGRGLDIRPHPHIGLSTVTYLFEGELVHRDSLGSDQVIRPGATNWMTAGRGIVHSERSTAGARASGPALHGLQLWAALPLGAEEDPPSFQHAAAGDIPERSWGGARIRVVAGRAYGEASPIRVHSPLFYVEARLPRAARIDLPGDFPERAAYVVEGAIEADGKAYRDGAMVVFREGQPACLSALEDSRAMLLGGAPLEGERHLWWNFVSSRKDRIERARQDWAERAFPPVPGDDQEFVPLPDDRRSGR